MDGSRNTIWFHRIVWPRFLFDFAAHRLYNAHRVCIFFFSISKEEDNTEYSARQGARIGSQHNVCDSSALIKPAGFFSLLSLRFFCLLWFVSLSPIFYSIDNVETSFPAGWSAGSSVIRLQEFPFLYTGPLTTYQLCFVVAMTNELWNRQYIILENPIIYNNHSYSIARLVTIILSKLSVQIHQGFFFFPAGMSGKCAVLFLLDNKQTKRFGIGRRFKKQHLQMLFMALLLLYTKEEYSLNREKSVCWIKNILLHTSK